jgi:hypothetical protein
MVGNYVREREREREVRVLEFFFSFLAKFT